ncbi:hypothetical protein ES705_06698 [subsurface metagenome]
MSILGEPTPIPYVLLRAYLLLPDGQQHLSPLWNRVGIREQHKLFSSLYLPGRALFCRSKVLFPIKNRDEQVKSPFIGTTGFASTMIWLLPRTIALLLHLTVPITLPHPQTGMGWGKGKQFNLSYFRILPNHINNSLRNLDNKL